MYCFVILNSGFVVIVVAPCFVCIFVLVAVVDYMLPLVSVLVLGLVAVDRAACHCCAVVAAVVVFAAVLAVFGVG